MLAEDAITNKILGTYNIGLDKLALDFTNYFTYISTNNEKNNLAKRGRNKQKRYDLKQCSLAIVTSKEAGIPLYSHVYEGNKNDQTEFSQYLPILEKRMPNYNPEEITLIFDGGSVTKKNLKALKTHYICSFSLAYCKELYSIDITKYSGLKINNRTVLCYRTRRNICDKERTCILTFSQKLFDGQVRELNENIAKALNDLEELNSKINNSKSRIDKSEKGLNSKLGEILKHKHVSDIISAQITENKIIYELNNTEKLNIMKRYFGKKLTITDRDDWSTTEILKTYYEQDCIEKIFRDTKNVEHFSLRPIFHWTEQKIRVHIFITLLGLTISSALQKELLNSRINISKTKMLEELSKIRVEEMDKFLSDLWVAV